MTPRIVVVTGGRYYGKMHGPKGVVRETRVYQNERWHVWHVLDVLDKTYRVDGSGITRVVQGGAEGADEQAAAWGHERSKVVVTYHYVRAEGRSGGPVRNEAQASDLGVLRRALGPDSVLVVVFPGGHGTAGARRLLEAEGIPILDESKGWGVYRIEGK